MAKFFKFGSIDAFRNTAKDINFIVKKHKCSYPQITFTGTIKIHGTNSGIGYDVDTGTIWAQMYKFARNANLNSSLW